MSKPPSQIPEWVEDPAVYQAAQRLKENGTLLRAEYEAYEALDRESVITSRGLQQGGAALNTAIRTAAQTAAVAEEEREDTARAHQYESVGATSGFVGGIAVGAVVGAGAGGVGAIPGGTAGAYFGTATGLVAGSVANLGVEIWESRTGRNAQDIATNAQDYRNEMTSAVNKISAALDTNDIGTPANGGTATSARRNR